MSGVYVWAVPIILVDDWGMGWEARYANPDGSPGAEVDGAGWADTPEDAVAWATESVSRYSPGTVAVVKGVVRQGYREARA